MCSGLSFTCSADTSGFTEPSYVKSDHSLLFFFVFDLQVRFVMGEGTTLGDLLELQLHRVEDEVKNIVDKAVKEMAIEKVGIQNQPIKKKYHASSVPFVCFVLDFKWQVSQESHVSLFGF